MNTNLYIRDNNNINGLNSQKIETKKTETFSPAQDTSSSCEGTTAYDLNCKIIAYLEKEILNAENDEDKKNRQEVINWFKNAKGECWGLATLWVYARRLEDEENKDQKTRDDLTNFHKVHRLFLCWDEKSDINDEDKKKTIIIFY